MASNNASGIGIATSVLQGALQGVQSGQQIKQRRLQNQTMEEQLQQSKISQQNTIDDQFYYAFAPTLDATAGGRVDRLPVEVFWEQFKKTTEGKDATAAQWDKAGNLVVQYPSGKTLTMDPATFQFKARLGATRQSAQRGRGKTGQLTENQIFQQNQTLKKEFQKNRSALDEALSPTKIAVTQEVAKKGQKKGPYRKELDLQQPAIDPQQIRKEFTRTIEAAPDQATRQMVVDESVAQLDTEIRTMTKQVDPTIPLSVSFFERESGYEKRTEDLRQTTAAIKELQNLRKEMLATVQQRKTMTKPTSAPTTTGASKDPAGLLPFLK